MVMLRGIRGIKANADRPINKCLQGSTAKRFGKAGDQDGGIRTERSHVCAQECRHGRSQSSSIANNNVWRELIHELIEKRILKLVCVDEVHLFCSFGLGFRGEIHALNTTEVFGTRGGTLRKCSSVMQDASIRGLVRGTPSKSISWFIRAERPRASTCSIAPASRRCVPSRKMQNSWESRFTMAQIGASCQQLASERGLGVRVPDLSTFAV